MNIQECVATGLIKSEIARRIDPLRYQNNTARFSRHTLSRSPDILGVGVNGGVAVLRQQQKKKKKGDKTGRQIVRTIERRSECGRRSPLAADARFCQEETVKEERGEGMCTHRARVNLTAILRIRAILRMHYRLPTAYRAEKMSLQKIA